MQNVESVGAALAKARAVCASLRTGLRGADVAKVISSTVGEGVEPMDCRVDKMQVVPRIVWAQYWRVGIDNYLVWAMQDSESSYILVSTGLCKELGLTIDKTQLPGNYQVDDGATCKFAGRL